jgi:hypothetical protein
VSRCQLAKNFGQKSTVERVGFTPSVQASEAFLMGLVVDLGSQCLLVVGRELFKLAQVLSATR